MKDKAKKLNESERSPEEIKRLKQIQEETESYELRESIKNRLKGKDVKK